MLLFRGKRGDRCWEEGESQGVAEAGSAKSWIVGRERLFKEGEACLQSREGKQTHGG